MTNTHPPLFEQIKKSELWYGLLPELLSSEHKWLIEHGQKVFGLLSENQRPYLMTAITLWEQALFTSSQGNANFAAYTLRSILERAAFLWATSKEIGLDPEIIITSYESDNKRLRRQTTDSIIDAAGVKDTDIQILYDEMLSRYYSHLSHLDAITIDETNKNKNKLKVGSQILPLLLLFDVGNCIVKVIEHLLKENSIQPTPFTGGRKGHEFSASDYIRAATYVMCEKHSRKKAIRLGMLITSIAEFKGKIGLTDIYRGGMEIYRYGDPSDKPELSKIKEFSLFAVGHADQRRIVANLDESTSKGERYTLRWPKEWDITYAAIGMIARNPQKYELFDYVTEFVKLFKK